MAGESTEADLGHAEALLSGTRRAGIWGLGYIGSSTFAALADARVRTVGYDVDPRQADAGAALAEDKGWDALATTDIDNILGPDVSVHLLAVPTEQHDQPYDGAIIEVVRQITQGVADGRLPRGTLVVVESTLAPGTTSRCLIPLIEAAGLLPDEDVLLVLAPRRDWLTLGDDGLSKLDRVFGGIGPRSAAAAHGCLSIMSRNLHEARTHIEAELVKCVENAFRHIDIMMANQLSLAFPHVDMVDVLRLAATKWNMNEYHPSFGSGGYCIPLAGRYLLQGATHPGTLSLVDEALRTDETMREEVAEVVATRGPVLILGLAYKGDVKVATLSPTIGIAKHLREKQVLHTIRDPHFTDAEVMALTGSPASRDLEDEIARAGSVLVVTDHEAFRSRELLALLTAERTEKLLILDNYGVLADVEWPAHVAYRRAGGPSWLCAPDLAAPARET